MKIYGTGIALAALLHTGSAVAWEYEQLVDDFDGETHHRILVASEPGSEPAVLSLGCEEDGHPSWTYAGDVVLESTLSYSSLGTFEEVSLRLSVDGEPVRGALANGWLRGTDYRVATTNTHRAVTKKLADGNRLIVRTISALGETNDAVFDISGLEAALSHIEPYCRRI